MYSAEAMIQSDPVFSLENQYFMSQNERYEDAVRKSVHLSKKAAEMGWATGGPELAYCHR